MDLFAGRCLLSAVGAPFLLASLYQVRRGVRLHRVGVQTSARVVSYEIADEECPTLLVEFADRSGIPHRAAVRVVGDARPAIGESVEIVYDPDKPGLASRADLGDVWLVGGALAFMGGGFELIAWFGG